MSLYMSKTKVRQRKRRATAKVARPEEQTEEHVLEAELSSGDQTETITEPEELKPLSFEDAAKQVLDGNDHGGYTIPGHGLYPHQWLWDSCFIAIGMRHYDVERAQVEIMSLLRGQWHNGMLPHMIINPNPRDADGQPLRDSDIWRSWLNPNAPDDVSTSGITQPPVLAEAIVRVGEQLKWPERRAWYKRVYPALLAYHLWLFNERDPHGEGLVLQIHPWETGLDNTPPCMHELHEHLLPWWISAMQKLRLDTVFGWFRSDRKFVATDERESNVEALALYDAQRRFRRKNYDFDKIIDHSLFAIEDLSFNAIFIRANTHLVEIAKAIREELPPEILEGIKKGPATLEELWDDYAGEYFSRDFVSHKLLKQSSIATFMPLYAGCISKERAASIVKLLENEHRFGPAYPVPSAPLDSPWFRPHKYWRGPTWVNTNWLIIDGLERYGFNEHAAALRESTLEMVKEAGFYEYFSPIDGSGAGTNNFSWTAALAIDLYKKK
jgi:hypothetical protein